MRDEDRKSDANPPAIPFTFEFRPMTFLTSRTRFAVMSTRIPTAWLRLASLVVCLCSGCATLSFPWDGHRFPQASARNPVVRIVCLWEPAEGRDPDGLPCRGFAGQILFLANRNALPVQAHGDVRIYLFDNVGTPEEQSRPLHQFDFASEAWQLHLSKSAVGPTYSVFIPYTRRGQYNAKCTLRMRFHQKDGPVIFSDATTLPLRGPSSDPDATTIFDPARQNGDLSKPPSAASDVNGRTTTIPLAKTNAGNFTLVQPDKKTNGDDTAQRLERMEKLLAEALAAKGAQAESGVVPASYETAVAEESPPPRIKLRAPVSNDD